MKRVSVLCLILKLAAALACASGCDSARAEVDRTEHPAIEAAWAKRSTRNNTGKVWCVRFFRNTLISGSGIPFANKADAIEYAKAELTHGTYMLEAVVTLSFDDDFPTHEEYLAGEWFVKQGFDQYAKGYRTQPPDPVSKPHLGVNPNPS